MSRPWVAAQGHGYPRGRRTLALVCAAASTMLLSRESLAQAAQPRFGLEWTRKHGAERCISEADLGAAVEARVGRSVFTDAYGADLVIRGSIELAEPSTPASWWQVSIQLRTRDGAIVGTRDLASETTDCRTLDDGLALVIALLLDPEANAKGEATPLAAAPAPASPPSSGGSGSTSSPKASQRWRAGISAGGAWSAGLMPSFAMGPVVELSVAHGQGPVFRLHGAYWPVQMAIDTVGQQARVGVAHAGLSCEPVLLTRRWLSWEAGIRGDLGALWATGLSLADNESDTGLLVLALAETRLSASLGSLVLSTSGAVGVPVIRPNVVYGPGGNDPVKASVFGVSSPVALLQLVIGFRAGGS